MTIMMNDGWDISLSRIRTPDAPSPLAVPTGSAVCGNCGKTLSEHYHEDQEYCFENTTGDIFTDDPSDTILADYIRATYPELHSSYVIEWKKRNGHQPNIEDDRRRSP